MFLANAWLFSVDVAEVVEGRKAVTKRSWTVSFICVADRYQSRIPSSTDKQVLFHAGLGMKKIKLDLEDDKHDVLEKMTCGDKGDDGEIKGFHS